MHDLPIVRSHYRFNVERASIIALRHERNLTESTVLRRAPRCNRDRVVAVRIQQPGRQFELRLRTDIAYVATYLPAVDEDDGAVVMRRDVVDAQRDRHVLAGGKFEMEARAIPVDARLVGGAGQGSRGPALIGETRKLPAHAFAVESARVEGSADGVEQVLATGVALDLPGNGRGRAGERGGDQPARFTEGAVVFLLVVPGVVDQHGDDVVAARLQPAGIDGELLRATRVVAEEMTIEPGGENAVVTQVHAGICSKEDAGLLARRLEVAAVPD